MSKAVVFFAGAAFAFGIVVTCGGRPSSPVADAGHTPGLPDTSGAYEIGVHDVHAQGQPSGTTYAYAAVNPFGWGIGMPAGVSSPDISGCSTQNDSEKIACVLNSMAADRWELVAIDAGSAHVQYVFKRAR